MPMKTFRRLPAVILSALLVTRCGSNTPTTPTLSLPDVPPSQTLPSSGAAVTTVIAGVTAADGTLAKEQAGSLPAANGGPTVEVTTNPTVVNGGSDEARLQSPTKFDTAYVSVSNTTGLSPFSTNQLHPRVAAIGYFKLDLPAPTTDISIVVTLVPSLPNSTFTVGYALAMGSAVGPTEYRTKTVVTPPVPCQFTVAGNTRFGAAGGSGTLTLTVTEGTNCSWTATSEAAFITNVAPGSGTGDATVTFTVTRNNATTERTGTINVAGQTFTINQEGATPTPPTCTYSTYSVSPTTVAAGAASGTFTVNVTTTAASCTWSAASSASFVTVTGGASGSGNGTVTFSVAANSSTSSRSGTLTIAGRTVTVNQEGATPPCTYSLSSTAVTASASGQSSTTTVTTRDTCTWTAGSNAPFLTITGGGSGTGNGTVTFRVDANNGAARTGTLTIAGQTVTVSQPALTANLTVSPSSNPVPFSGAPGTIGNCVGSYNTWFYSVTLAETAGVTVTITRIVDMVDGAVVNDVARNTVISGRGSTTLQYQWCWPMPTEERTVQSTFSGTDSNGHAISVTSPRITLLAKPGSVNGIRSTLSSVPSGGGR
jgi:hypothetical protein